MNKEEFRQIRLDKKLTQDQFSKALGVSQISVRRVELGLQSMGDMMKLKFNVWSTLDAKGGVNSINLSDARKLLASINQ